MPTKPSAVKRRASASAKSRAWPTVKIVAEMAGVSTATVSRALSKPDLVSDPILRRVRAAADKAGYTPNALARNLRRMETKSVLIVLPDISNPFFGEIIQGAESVALARGYCVLVGNTNNDAERERAYADVILGRRADGLLLLNGHLPEPWAGFKGAGKGPPIVIACEWIPGTSLPTVRIDNFDAAFQATRYLIDLGHRRIAHIAGPKGNVLRRERMLGYREAMRKAGLRPISADGDFSIESGFAATVDLLDRNDRPTAIFAANDETAIGVIQAVKARSLSVPRDISVVGFDDIRFAAANDPPLTTVSQPRVELGRRSMELLCDILENKPHIPQEVIVPTSFIVRGSTGSGPDAA